MRGERLKRWEGGSSSSMLLLLLLLLLLLRSLVITMVVVILTVVVVVVVVSSGSSGRQSTSGSGGASRSGAGRVLLPCLTCVFQHLTTFLRSATMLVTSLALAPFAPPPCLPDR